MHPIVSRHKLIHISTNSIKVVTWLNLCIAFFCLFVCFCTLCNFLCCVYQLGFSIIELCDCGSSQVQNHRQKQQFSGYLRERGVVGGSKE